MAKKICGTGFDRLFFFPVHSGDWLPVRLRVSEPDGLHQSAVCQPLLSGGALRRKCAMPGQHIVRPTKHSLPLTKLTNLSF